MPQASKICLSDARPYPFAFPSTNTALVIIDMQRDFLEPDGFGYIQCGDPTIFSSVRTIVPNVQKALEAARSIGMHVIHTREGHRSSLSDLPAAKYLRQANAPNGHHTMRIGDQGPMGRLLVRGQWGHGIIDQLKPFPGEPVIDKPGKGSFWATEFHRVLLARGITHLILAGVTTECCVTTTLRECNDRGFECCILADCTNGFDQGLAMASLDTICCQDGLFGYVGHSHDLVQFAEQHRSSRPRIATHSVRSGPFPSMALLKKQYTEGLIDPEAVIRDVFMRIREYEAIDPAVWISKKSEEDVLLAARELSAAYTGKPLPPLYGIPFAVKDNIDVEGIVTTVACDSFAYCATTTAPAIQHLLDAGALYIGKLNLDQFATGLSGCRSPYGIPHCAYSKEHISGGSSSGSAVAVAVGLVSFSVGTDTAGSTRIPAALNGVVGFKPTKGTISARGLVPACKSLDTITLFAPSLIEAREIWYVLDKHDALDPYAKLPSTLSTWAIDFRGIRDGGFTFAVPPSSLLQTCSESYQALFRNAIDTLQSCGGSLQDIDFSPFSTAGDLLYGASLLHERLSSLGPQFLTDKLETLHPVTKSIFKGALESTVKAWEAFRDLEIQTHCLAQTRRAFDKLEGGIDVLVVPAVPYHPTIQEMLTDPLHLNSKLGTFSHFGNVVDLCGVSVNAGWIEEAGGAKLPFGITFLGGAGHDGKVLDIAGVFEDSFTA